MVPDIDMNAIVSSAVFQPDSWSAFSFYESLYLLGSAGELYQSPQRHVWLVDVG